jgi:hypothetical protein
MIIHDYIQEVDRISNIQIGVQKRSNGAIRSFGTHSACGNNYKYDRKRHNTRNVKSTYGTRGRHDSSRIPPRVAESKGNKLT